jgi:fructose-bisphosphate aldolase class II
MALLQIVKTGVVSGNSIGKILEYMKKNNFAIPSVSIINTESINAILESASKSNSAIMLQINSESTKFLGGKIPKGDPTILGAITTAQYIHLVATYYKIPVFIVSGFGTNNQLEWLDRLIQMSEDNYKKQGKPLFTLHSLDVTQMSFIDGIKLAQKYLKRLTKIGAGLEIRTDTSHIEPKELLYMYWELNKISTNYIIQINLKDENYKNCINTFERVQKYIKKEFKTNSKPLNLVIERESCKKSEIKQYINEGVVKLNIDKELEESYSEAIATITSTSNNKFYDPKKVMREIQKIQVKCITTHIKEFNSKNTL